MEIFDLLVVGGGPGGYLCDERAAQGGLKVCLFEKRALGGTCLNEGCIPTKTLLNSAKLYRHATESEAFGVTVQGATYDHAKVVSRKDKVVKALVSGVGTTMRDNGVTVISAAAKIQGRAEEGFQVAADGQVYTGRRLVIATGSQAVIPPVPGLRENAETGFVMTNREALDLKELPKSLAIMGGGVIGLEMAYYYTSVGVDVTVIEMMPKIAGSTDPEICKVLTETFKKQGMKIKTSAQVVEVKPGAVYYLEDGQRKELTCDKVLVSVGRRPNTDGLGLEALGLEMDRSAIVVDRHLCTTVSGVYAVGDCNGKCLLAHAAYRQAEVAVNHMLGKTDEMRYDVVPAVIYTDPEVATVGLSKETAESRGMRVKEVKLPMSYAGRYLAETRGGKGFIKLVVDTDRNRLVGCHMVGSYASEIIMTATMMVDTELTPNRLQKLVFPHPTVAEIIREAIFHI